MNDLSLFLYAADVVGSVKGVAWFGAVVTFAVSGFMMGARADGNKDIKRGHIRAGWAGLFACILIASLTPGKQTMYAIAASEVGERVISSPTGERAIRAIDAWLDRQIGETKTKESDQ